MIPIGKERMSVGDKLHEISELLLNKEMSSASSLAKELPQPPVTTIKFPVLRKSPSTTGAKIVKAPSLVPRQKIEIYKRDGFICRYSPERFKLLHPGAIRVLSLLLPIEIPTELSSHNIPAKYATNSPIWFDIWPAVDHFVPKASGGSNVDDNLVCCSWWRNDTKKAIPFEDTGWVLGDRGHLSAWDGLTGWLKKMIEKNPELTNDVMVRNWMYF
jgi:hypothetical protein